MVYFFGCFCNIPLEHERIVIIIIIIITIIICHLYVGYLELYTWNEPCF